jgi:cation diffusion facilitator family transporter
VALGSAAVSVGLLGLLVAVHLATDSNLALSQAADSFSDVFTAIALFVSMRVAAAPPDEDHPAGHQRAEPVAALIAAVMAGVVAFEVLRGAITDLFGGYEPIMSYPLLGVFALKIAIKGGVIVFAMRVSRTDKSPALGALVVDARNDVLVGLLAVVGFFAARAGGSQWDAWLAIPVALWVGASGFMLARENIGFLMGEAPEPARRRDLEAIAASVPGVISVHNLVASFHGAELDVLIHVVVDPSLSLRAAHDIGHAVESKLLAEDDVCNAVVHVDVDVAADDAHES